MRRIVCQDRLVQSRTSNFESISGEPIRNSKFEIGRDYAIQIETYATSSRAYRPAPSLPERVSGGLTACFRSCRRIRTFLPEVRALQRLRVRPPSTCRGRQKL